MLRDNSASADLFANCCWDGSEGGDFRDIGSGSEDFMNRNPES